ncbi:MAG TPA: M1 family aminopeptidase [Acidobacteriaceae bacterium]
MLVRRVRSLSALVVLSMAAFISGTGAQAQRLPDGVVPEHYTLALTPDLKAATFTGTESIGIRVEKPTNTITLNSLEIKIQEVTVEQACQGCQNGNGLKLTGTVAYDESKEQATFTFPDKLRAGHAVLHLKYTGILNDKLRGFYLSKTPTRNYAVTQFESTDARRAYPSWDEPALKATYDLSLTVDAGDSVIANTPVLTDVPAGEGTHTITFTTTPKMSTYLLAFLVGDFKCISGGADGVPIRVCATPDKVQYGKLALATAEHTLHFYNNYFGIKYPMPKLDMIGLPDFEAGAMENFGAITYRETDLLLDEEHASIPQKKRVAVVVTHEMAHQWFGDMVTMQWWDNLWLNEGFATWMETKAANDFNPAWKYKQDEAGDLDNSLNTDSQATTRTIRAKADTPAEINEEFDGIAYGKAGAVIGMVEHYVGEETFRQGVHNYLQAHMYGNATAEDFWNAQTAVSHKPIDKIMESFVTQPGVPLLTFGPESKTAKKTVTVAQSRFFLSPTFEGNRNQKWTIPVCFKTVKGDSCELVSSASGTLVVPNAPFLYANADAKGYYRSAYTKEQQKAIAAHAESNLSPTERLGLVGDVWSLMRSGQGSVGVYMDLTSGLRNESEVQVQESVLSKLSAVQDRIASKQDSARLKAWIVATYAPVYAKLPPAGGTADQQQLRGLLFGVLGAAGDAGVLAEARRLTSKYVDDPNSVDANIAGSAIQLAAAHGDEALYEKLLALSKSASNPDVQTTALLSLARFNDPKLLTRTLDYATSGAVKNQDSWILISLPLRRAETKDQTWEYVRTHWPAVKAQLTTSSGAGLVSSTGAFCTAEKRDEVKSFFTANPVPAAARAQKKTIDTINSCIELHTAQEQNLKVWLDHNAAQ